METKCYANWQDELFNNAGLTNLERLNLDSCKVSDEGIEHVKGDTRFISSNICICEFRTAFGVDKGLNGFPEVIFFAFASNEFFMKYPFRKSWFMRSLSGQVGIQNKN